MALNSGKTWLKPVGIALALLGAAFFLRELYVNSGQVSLQDLSTLTYLGLFILTLSYVGANFALAFGWHAVLRFLSCDVTMDWCLRVYAQTQIAKYIPGNIFHYGARQVASANASIPQATMLRASVIEFVVITGIAAFALPYVLFSVLLTDQNLVELGLVLTCLIIVIAIVCATLCLNGLLRRIAIGYGAHVAISSLIFLTIFALVITPPSTWQSALTICFSFTISWLLGVVTPGAPAGLGVREAALLVLLANLATAGQLLSIIIISRVVTSLGDFIFFAVWGRSVANN